MTTRRFTFVLIGLLVCSAAIVLGDVAQTATTQPTTRPAVPPHFYFTPATGNKKILLEWTQTTEKTWTETVGDQRPSTYQLVGPSRDPKDPGMILVRTPARDIEVYVPTDNNKDRRLGWRYVEGKRPPNAPPNDTEWYTLGTMDAEPKSNNAEK